ncbi:MAG: magnesium transporter CorA family protein [Muribaculaceae bacterium]|nr:magnesium transporter CorA family protein [Muribaculaceae bacterium]
MISIYNCATGLAELNKYQPNCWINVETPSDDDINFLITELKVPESFLNDISDIDERPRTENEGNWLLTIIRIPIQIVNHHNQHITVPLGIMSNHNIIVTVCNYHSDMLPDFVDYSRRKNIEIDNRLDLILRLIHSSAVWFLKYLKQVNIEVTAAEESLQRSIRNQDLLRLMKLQKTLVYFSTSIKGNEATIGRLKAQFQDSGLINKDIMEDLIIELRQAISTVNIYSNILSGTMDTFASIISNNVNTIMKRMTSISIILMVPTLIASFFGMNVELYIGGYDYAFIGIILCSIILSTLAFILFRKIKWF